MKIRLENRNQVNGRPSKEGHKNYKGKWTEKRNLDLMNWFLSGAPKRAYENRDRNLVKLCGTTDGGVETQLSKICTRYRPHLLAFNSRKPHRSDTPWTLRDFWCLWRATSPNGRRVDYESRDQKENASDPFYLAAIMFRHPTEIQRTMEILYDKKRNKGFQLTGKHVENWGTEFWEAVHSQLQRNRPAMSRSVREFEREIANLYLQLKT